MGHLRYERAVTEISNGGPAMDAVGGVKCLRRSAGAGLIGHGFNPFSRRESDAAGVG